MTAERDLAIQELHARIAASSDSSGFEALEVNYVNLVNAIDFRHKDKSLGPVVKSLMFDYVDIGIPT